MPIFTIAELITKSPDELSLYTKLIFNDFHDKDHVLDPAIFIGFCNAIAACSNLKHVDLSDFSFCFLTIEQLSLLCQAISNSHLKLEVILLESTLSTDLFRIEEKQAQPIIDLIQRCQKLTSISLANNSLGPIQCVSPLSKIIEALKYKPLKYLNLQNCAIGISDFLTETFCDTVQTLSSLECLLVAKNYFGYYYLSTDLKLKIFHSLTCCNQLQILNISNNFRNDCLLRSEFMDVQTFQSFKTMLIKCVFLEQLVVHGSLTTLQLEELLDGSISKLRILEQKKRDKITLLCFQFAPKELKDEVLKWISKPAELKISILANMKISFGLSP